MENLIYIAIDDDGTVLTVNTNRDNIKDFVFDYYGINPNKEYSHPSICKGFKKIEYSEFEDDLIGYWIFETDGEENRVNLWEKLLNEKI